VDVYYSASVSTEPTVTEVEVTPFTASLNVGESITLTAEVRGANAPSQQVTWISSNNNVATVNGSGFVAAVGEGNVTITATSIVDSSRFGYAEISVSAPPPQQGNLQINIDGLPTGVVHVVGGTYDFYDFMFEVSGSVTLALPAPDSYTISAYDVTVNGVIYEPAPRNQSANVTSDQTTTVTVTYSGQPDTTPPPSEPEPIDPSPVDPPPTDPPPTDPSPVDPPPTDPSPVDPPPTEPEQPDPTEPPPTEPEPTEPPPPGPIPTEPTPPEPEPTEPPPVDPPPPTEPTPPEPEPTEPPPTEPEPTDPLPVDPPPPDPTPPDPTPPGPPPSEPPTDEASQEP
jgi:hypothetical protein